MVDISNIQASMYANRFNKAKTDLMQVETAIAVASSSELNGIKGLGADTISKLNAIGMDTKAKLMKADMAVLKEKFNPLVLKHIKNFIES